MNRTDRLEKLVKFLVDELARIMPYEARQMFRKRMILEIDEDPPFIEDQPDPAVAPSQPGEVSGQADPPVTKEVPLEAPGAFAGMMQPLPRVFHQKVLDALMQRIQGATGQQTTERNAVELLDDLIAAKKEEPQIPDGIHAALKAAEILKAQLNDAMDAVNAFSDLEPLVGTLKGTLADVDSNLGSISGEMDSWFSGFHAMRQLPTCVESLTKAMGEIKQRTDNTSVQASINFNLSAEQWGLGKIDDDPAFLKDTCDRLNYALAQACEFSLIQILRSGIGFGNQSKNFVDQGLERFLSPLSSLATTSVLALAGRVAYSYFGITD